MITYRLHTGVIIVVVGKSNAQLSYVQARLKDDILKRICIETSTSSAPMRLIALYVLVHL